MWLFYKRLRLYPRLHQRLLRLILLLMYLPSPMYLSSLLLRLSLPLSSFLPLPLSSLPLFPLPLFPPL
jgi:hypothetical protein